MRMDERQAVRRTNIGSIDYRFLIIYEDGERIDVIERNHHVNGNKDLLGLSIPVQIPVKVRVRCDVKNIVLRKHIEVFAIEHIFVSDIFNTSCS